MHLNLVNAWIDYVRKNALQGRLLSVLAAGGRLSFRVPIAVKVNYEYRASIC